MNQFQKSQSEKIKACYESENLEKAEGSRGGKVYWSYENRKACICLKG